MKLTKIKLLILFCILSGCSYCPNTAEYRDQYAHLNVNFSEEKDLISSPYFLIVLVNARHLDYSCPKSLFKTLAKHPSDGSKNGDVGHAWIYLQGLVDGKPVYIEGGHSGELGRLQPRYVDGLFQCIERGDANPISYLWTTQKDGFFQWGSGGHIPTFAAAVNLNECEFRKILKFIEVYDFSQYAITGNQCCTFVSQIASFADWNLDCAKSLKVEKEVTVAGMTIPLWQDSFYSEFHFFCPDILEKSLIESVIQGRSKYALSWYKKNHKVPFKYKSEDILLFPKRLVRYLAV